MAFATKEELLKVGILDCPDVKEKKEQADAR